MISVEQLRKFGEHFGTRVAECPMYRGFVIAAVYLGLSPSRGLQQCFVADLFVLL